MTSANPDILSFTNEKAASEICRNQLEKILREGALKLLLNALEREADDCL
ncbi:MAG: hypothetical protein AAGJ31_08715 [Verrucomicrobiota bacterium]